MIIPKDGAPPFTSWEDYERLVNHPEAPTPLSQSISLDMPPTPLSQSISLDMRYSGVWYDAVRVYTMLTHGMVADNLSQDVLRVSINEDGTFNIVDFTLPSSEGRIKKNLAQVDVPQWVMESVSMLRISDANEKVDELGMKIHDKLYYIKERANNE